MRLPVPEPSAILARIVDVQAREKDSVRSVGEWRSRYKKSLRANRSMTDLEKFLMFTNNMLERAMIGEAFSNRQTAFEKVFKRFQDVTPVNAKKALREAGYRWGPEVGADVVMGAKKIATRKGFAWEKYVRDAEEAFEDDFKDDPFLAIPNVGFKTRDLGLSTLSDRFIAIDLHVVRVTSRTGLLLHGYGDPEITTEVGKPGGKGYMFFHHLMLKLARRTGWPTSGYSPGEIDRMLWYFGRAVCNDEPGCEECPLAGRCLTHVRAR